MTVTMFVFACLRVRYREPLYSILRFKRMEKYVSDIPAMIRYPHIFVMFYLFAGGPHRNLVCLAYASRTVWAVRYDTSHFVTHYSQALNYT
jgi:hypothetical protein